MPIVPFESLPDAARVWVFGSDRALADNEARTLLAAVDTFLGGWKAHGESLHAARAWLHDTFLVIGVDSTRENASGCSIDGLFRTLQRLQGELGATLLGGGRLFYAGTSGKPAAAPRSRLGSLVARGEITRETAVFDVGVTTVQELRDRFERRAADSWTSAAVAAAEGQRTAAGGGTTRNG